MRKRILTALCIFIVLCGVLLFVACDVDVDVNVNGDANADPCATGHTFGGEQVVTNPTCTQKGLSKRVCEACGKEEEIEVVATGHKKSDWIEDKATSCAAAGSKHIECTICSEVLETEGIQALAHTFGEWVVTREPTCSVSGQQTRACSACDVTEIQSLDKTDHVEGESRVVREPTHQKTGIKNIYCSVCNGVARTQTIAKITNCVWGDWERPAVDCEAVKRGEQVAIETRKCTVEGCTKADEREFDPHGYGQPVMKDGASCESGAVLLYVCERCEFEKVESFAPGHNYVCNEISVQSCTVDGVREYTCAYCAHTYTETDEKLGHNPGDFVVEAATCTADGVQYKTCQRCGVETEREVLAAHGHEIAAWEVTEPTCTEKGEKRAVVACAHCGETDITEEIAALGHAPNAEIIVILAPTCTVKGKQDVQCGRCQGASGSKVEDVAPLGHDYGEYETITPATCEETGEKQRTCTREGCEYKDPETVVIDALGHQLDGGTPEWTKEKDPTCTEPGLERATVQCKRCGETDITREIDAHGHNYGEYEIIVPATCEQTGVKQRTCQREGCGYKDPGTIVINALGHKDGQPVYDPAPTCLENGMSYTYCSRCQQLTAKTTALALGHDFSDWEEVGKLNTFVTLNGVTVDAYSIVKCKNPGCDLIHTKEEYARESKDKAIIDLSDYSLVYSASVSNTFKEKMAQLASKLYGYTGKTVSASTSGTSYVIKVVTGSDKDITGHGFSIRYSDNVITITGTTALITQMGVDYFMDTYLMNEPTDTSITLPKLAVSDDYVMVDVSGYTPIYDENADTSWEYNDVNIEKNPDNYYGVSSETGRDIEFDVAYMIGRQILGRKYKDSDSYTSYLTYCATADSETASANEILVGMTNRNQTQTALAMLQGHEYGFMVIDGRVVITGYSDAALHKMAQVHTTYEWSLKNGKKNVKLEILSMSLTGLIADYFADSKVNGEILLPANLRMIGEASDRWLTDETLLPTNLPLTHTADDADGAFQYLYQGNGVNKTAFDAYVNSLKAKGFTVLTKSDAEGSYFVTLTDPDRTQMIHVAYEAYAHANDNNKASSEWTAAGVDNPVIRVTTAYVQENYTIQFDDVKRPSGNVAKAEKNLYQSSVHQLYYLYDTSPTAQLKSYRSTLGSGYTIIYLETATERFVARNESTGEWIEAFTTENVAVVDDYGQYKTYAYAICWRYYAPGVITLPNAEILTSEQTYTKVTDTKIVSIDLSAATSSASYGTGYVIMLEDGRFVVIDGGSNDGSSTSAQINNFWSIVSALYKDVYDVEPSKDNPARIAAWIITHAHGDHMNMFWDFTSPKNEHQKKIKLDYLIANTPDYTTLYNTGEPNMNFNWELTKFQKRIDFEFIKPQTGHKYYFANLEIDTLFTHGNLNPQRIVTYNDSSTLQRLNFVRTADTTGARTVNHKTASASSKTSFLSTGDMYRWGGRWVAAMYGSYLQTDMVSVTHHGGVGVTAEFYDLVSPTVVWWSMDKNTVYTDYCNESTTAWNKKVDQHLLYNVDSVQYVYIADDYHITLVLKEDGSDYNNIYHATSGAGVGYYSVSKTNLKDYSSVRRTMCNRKPVAIHKY